MVFFKGTRHAGANHIALVTKVTKDTLYTIEGNTSTGKGVIANGGGVVEKKYSLSHSGIMGYGRPKYEGEETKEEPSGTSAGSSSSGSAGYYKKYTGKSERIDEVFKAIGVPAKFRDTYMKRKPVASKNGISNYKGSTTQNLLLVRLAKAGKLKKI